MKDTIEEQMVWEFSKDDKDTIKRIRVKMDISDVILEHGELYIKVINEENKRLLGTAHFPLGAMYGTKKLPNNEFTELEGTLRGQGVLYTKDVGTVKVALRLAISRDYIKEREQKIKDDAYLAATEKERETKSLQEVFAHFGRNVTDKLEHLEILRMYRTIEKAHNFKIQKLIDENEVGSEEHEIAKKRRLVIEKITAEFDYTYNLTAAATSMPRITSENIIERYFFYNFETGKLNVNFESVRKPDLPNFLVVYRKVFVDSELRDFLVEENTICEKKNALPLDNITLRSLAGPYYDALQKSAEEEILEKQHPFYRGGRIVNEARIAFENNPPKGAEDLESVPGGLYDDFPYNFGCLRQKKDSTSGALFYCLATDKCRERTAKNIPIKVINPQYEAEKEKARKPLLLKGGYKLPPYKMQTIDDLDIEGCVVKHLWDEHWTNMIQAGYDELGFNAVLEGIDRGIENDYPEQEKSNEKGKKQKK